MTRDAMLLREAVAILDALVRYIGDMEGRPWEDAREFLLRRELDEPPSSKPNRTA